MKKRAFVVILFIIAVLILFFLWPQKPSASIKYGVSFSKLHSDELGLDWKKAYLALLDDLKVRNFRFSAHWPGTEPLDGKFDFSVLDFQMKEAQKRNVSVILAVGRRLPGWPECHDPKWIEGKDSEFRNAKLLEYITAVVNRYKGYKNIKYWQVENEPFLAFFSRSACGQLDKDFLKQEIALVKSLDPDRSVLVTDSGEFGTWKGAHDYGDVFGTSMYLYIWNRRIGPMRYPITPGFFKLKQWFADLFFVEKPRVLIELSAEPWLLQPISSASTDVLLDRMGIDKFNEMLDFASRTGFREQYLWGAEWWYWLKVHKITDAHWNRAKELFNPYSLQ